MIGLFKERMSNEGTIRFGYIGLVCFGYSSFSVASIPKLINISVGGSVNSSEL